MVADLAKRWHLCFRFLRNDLPHQKRRLGSPIQLNTFQRIWHEIRDWNSKNVLLLHRTISLSLIKHYESCLLMAHSSLSATRYPPRTNESCDNYSIFVFIGLPPILKTQTHTRLDLIWDKAILAQRHSLITTRWVNLFQERGTICKCDICHAW